MFNGCVHHKSWSFLLVFIYRAVNRNFYSLSISQFSRYRTKLYKSKTLRKNWCYSNTNGRKCLFSSACAVKYCWKLEFFKNKSNIKCFKRNKKKPPRKMYRMMDFVFPLPSNTLNIIKYTQLSTTYKMNVNLD